MGAGTLINLHTHSHFSDGWFSPQEIAARAAEGGLTHVAITDHFQTSKVPRCLTSGQMDEYISTIRNLDRKHDGGLRVLAGVEIDTSPERCDLRSLPVDDLNRLDLVLFEYVNDEEMGGTTLSELDWLLCRLKVPCGLVHTDIARVFGGITPGEVADLLQSYGLFVEVNTASLYKEEGVPYYERAEEHYRAFKNKVRVSVGTDVHRLIDEVVNVSKGYRFLERCDLMDMLLL